MNRSWAVWILLALAVPLLAAPQKDRKEQDTGCDLKKTVTGPWCGSCRKLLSSSDVDKKTRACKKCSQKPAAATVCVKRFYQAECHPEKTSSKPIKCCKKKYSKPIEDCALVMLKCAGCGTSGGDKKSITHSSDCRKKKLVKACSKSGTAPHVRKN